MLNTLLLLYHATCQTLSYLSQGLCCSCNWQELLPFLTITDFRLKINIGQIRKKSSGQGNIAPPPPSPRKEMCMHTSTKIDAILSFKREATQNACTTLDHIVALSQASPSIFRQSAICLFSPQGWTKFRVGGKKWCVSGYHNHNTVWFGLLCKC